jgi:hypothetical protein
MFSVIVIDEFWQNKAKGKEIYEERAFDLEIERNASTAIYNQDGNPMTNARRDMPGSRFVGLQG